MTRKRERNGLSRRRQQRKIRRRCWDAVMDILVQHGFGGLARAVEILINEAPGATGSASALPAKPLQFNLVRSLNRGGDRRALWHSLRHPIHVVVPDRPNYCESIARRR